MSKYEQNCCNVLMFELFMYVYSCNALSAQFFGVDRALNSYFMIMIMIMRNAISNRVMCAYSAGSSVHRRTSVCGEPSQPTHRRRLATSCRQTCSLYQAGCRSVLARSDNS